LHYAFVKIGAWRNKSGIDPIETVSSLCGAKGLEMDVPDNWKKTPLHYAAQRGASICWICLNKRGVNKEAVDIYGNTPLGVALSSSHHNAAIIMIQKGANVRALVHQEDPVRLERERKQQTGADVEDLEMKGAESEEEHQSQAQGHRRLFD
jgi:ankyrin repeat protein